MTQAAPFRHFTRAELQQQLARSEKERLAGAVEEPLEFKENEELVVKQARLAVAHRGQLVTFYRNGDPHFKGLRTSVCGKMFATLDTLLAWLSEKVPMQAGVQHVFSLPEGTEMRDVTRFVGGRSYVVSSVRKIIHVAYGEPRERFWPRHRSSDQLASLTRLPPDPPPPLARPAPARTYPPSQVPAVVHKPQPKAPPPPPQPIRSQAVPVLPAAALTRRADDWASSLANTPSSSSSYSLQSERAGRGGLGGVSERGVGGEWKPPGKMNARPRILLITSNTDRTSQQKVIFNPQTTQSYEDVLLDVRSMVNTEFPPVTALYTAKAPYVKVLGIAHLTRELRRANEFLACGREAVPVEMQTQAPATQPSPRRGSLGGHGATARGYEGLGGGSDLDDLQDDSTRDLYGQKEVGSLEAPMGSYDTGVYDTNRSQYY